MSDPIRIQIRGSEEVRREWQAARGRFDLTHGEMALEAALFAIENEQQFRRHLQADERDSSSESR
jgi:hypothetical protein